MQVTLNKAKFVDVLSKIGKISKTTVFYNNKGLCVQSQMGVSDEFLNIQLNEEVSEIKPFGIDTNNLLEIIKTLSTPEIELQVKDNMLKITDGKKNYTLKLSENVMPTSVDFKITEGISMNMDALLKYMPYFKSVSAISGNTNNIPINIHENIMLATDARRLYRIRLPENMKFFEPTFIYNLNPLIEGDVICCKTDKRLVFARDHDYYSVQLVETSKLTVDELFEGYNEKQKCKVDSSILEDVKNALLIAKNDLGFKVTMKIKDDKINISTTNDFGSFETDYQGVEGSGEITFAVNCEFLKQALEFAFHFHEEVDVMFKDDISALYIVTHNKEIESLLMPIRL